MNNHVIVTGIRRKELDYRRLARALLAFAEELERDEEQTPDHAAEEARPRSRSAMGREKPDSTRGQP